MIKEIFWEKALEKSKLSIESGILTPLKTIDITKDLYQKDDFIIKKLDHSRFKFQKSIGPKINPFRPWEKTLEIAKIGNSHQLILNKYPVQLGHILLITNSWKPQDGWLDIDDWLAIKEVNKDTSGLWFFNSGPLAGASQPHRHIQLLRRKINEIICPREKWFINFEKYKKANNKLSKNIRVKNFKLSSSSEIIHNVYLELCRDLGLGEPLYDMKPKFPYNLLVTNNWMSIIKRKIDNINGFSINGLGFAGYILVTNKSNTLYLKKEGPEKLLENFV